MNNYNNTQHWQSGDESFFNKPTHCCCVFISGIFSDHKEKDTEREKGRYENRKIVCSCKKTTKEATNKPHFFQKKRAHPTINCWAQKRQTHLILKSVNRDLQLGESSSINSSTVVSTHKHLKLHSWSAFLRKKYLQFLLWLSSTIRETTTEHTHTHTVTLHVEWTTCEQTHQPNSLLNWFQQCVSPNKSNFIIVVINTHSNTYIAH